MKRNSLILITCVCMLGMASAQDVTGSGNAHTVPPFTTKLYDNFNHEFLSPALWNTFCYASNVSLECAVEIQDGQLRLVRRVPGQKNSNAGFQVGVTTASFSNPASIKSITTDLVIRDIRESPCTANPSYGGNAGIVATFFNAGSGDPSDDVGAQLLLGRVFSDPPGQLTVLGQFFQNGVYTYFFLGNVSLGTPVTVTLTWDKPNHQFLTNWTNDLTHVTTQGTMPYSFSDTTPAANPTKNLQADTLPSNCTAAQTWVYVESVFDNVYVGR
jgi:hypothetical protein